MLGRDADKKGGVILMIQPATVKDIAFATGLPKKRIRSLADEGLIAGNRNHKNWRVFPDKERTLRLIESLLTGN